MTDSIADFKEVVVAVDPKEFFTSIEVQKLKDISADSRHLRWGRTVVMAIMTLLVAVMNVYVIYLVQCVASTELELLSKNIISGSERIIDGKVYMSLIAGTIAEVSALFFIIVKSTFKH